MPFPKIDYLLSTTANIFSIKQLFPAKPIQDHTGLAIINVRARRCAANPIDVVKRVHAHLDYRNCAFVYYKRTRTMLQQTSTQPSLVPTHRTIVSLSLAPFGKRLARWLQCQWRDTAGLSGGRKHRWTPAPMSSRLCRRRAENKHLLAFALSKHILYVHSHCVKCRRYTTQLRTTHTHIHITSDTHSTQKHT